MKNVFTIFLLLTALTLGFGQDNYWSVSSSERSYQNTPKTSDYNIFSLDIAGLTGSLDSAPMRGATSSKSEYIMIFPTYAGNMEQYRVVETQALHPDLSRKYPGIKSFVGRGISDLSTIIRFSISNQRGFHGLMMSGKDGMTYIDPISGDKQTYAVYRRISLSKADREFQCMTEENVKRNSSEGNPIMSKTNDKKLRKYRLALSCTAEYGNIFAGTGTDEEKKAKILAQMNITMTRVNGVYERDLAVTMELVANNDDIIYFGDVNADPWSSEWNSKTQQTIDNVIGDANYDIGHNFNTTGGGNAGCIGCVCTSGSKGSAYTGRANPTGDPFDIDYVAHEMGHQFGGFHTMNTCSRSGSGNTEVEPESGSTIMGYAGICPINVQSNSDAYFHYVNIRDMSANVQSGVSSSCPEIIDLTNNPPTADAGVDYTIPKSTPFVLKGQGSDPDGDMITYTWEQNDPEQAPSASSPESNWAVGPLFRSVEGTTSPDRYMPQISDVLSGNLGNTWEVLPSVARTMEFALTVRDNNIEGGQTSDDLMEVTVDGTSGPFLLTEPNAAITWYEGQAQIVVWNVAGTDQAPVNCTRVNILLSTDGGLTYPITLLSEAPNTGNAEVTVPNNLSSTCRVKIEAVGNIFYDLSNTDFQISAAVACNTNVPTGLATSSVNSSDATITWDENVGAIFDVQYSLSGANTWTTVSAGGNIKQITGLTPETAYDVQVRSRCTSTSSDYSTIVMFITTELELVYCDSQGNDQSDEFISRVQLGTIDNVTGGTSGGYVDYTSISTDLLPSTEYTITITPTWTGTIYDEGYSVWIDYNQNGSFDDSGEQVWSKPPSKDTPVSGVFTVPATALTGMARMRVTLKYDGIPTSCESFSYGEVEDYTINIGNQGIVLDFVGLSSNNANNQIARIGDEVTLTLTPSDIIQTPTITILGNTVSAAQDGNNWTASYTLTASDSEGNVSFTIDYLDLDGNVGEQVFSTTNGSHVDFSTTAFALSLVDLSSNNANNQIARIGDDVTLNITPIDLIQTPTITILGNTVSAAQDGNNWTASYTLTESDPEGDVLFTIDYSDLAGNEGTQVTSTTNSSSVDFDKTAPTLPSIDISSNNTNSQRAKVGDEVILTMTPIEMIQTPIITILGNTVSATQDGNDWTASYTLTESDPEGNVSFTIDYSDLAGNDGMQVISTTNGSSVDFDKTAPTLTSVAVTSDNEDDQAIAAVDDMVTLTFTTSEDVAEPVVMIAGEQVTPSLSGETWTATRVMLLSDDIGVLEYSINFSDYAGNAGDEIATTTDGSSIDFIGLVTGTERPSISDQVSIYPNPTNNTFSIRMNEGYKNQYEVLLTNIIGKVIKKVVVNKKQSSLEQSFDLSDQSKGIYLIKISTNQATYIYRIVKD